MMINKDDRRGDSYLAILYASLLRLADDDDDNNEKVIGIARTRASDDELKWQFY